MTIIQRDQYEKEVISYFKTLPTDDVKKIISRVILMDDEHLQYIHERLCGSKTI